MSASVRRVTFHGTGGALFRLVLVNFLLTVLTFGIYSFWAKSRVRAYLYSQTDFDGDRFAYHGTGSELFRGWLKAMGIVIVFGLVAVALTLSVSEVLGYLLLYAGIGLLLFPMALVGSRRYRLTRTTWRGIRFSFRGTWQDFLRVYLPGMLLTVLTLYLYYPYFHANVRRFLVDDTYFGSERFEFRGEGRDLFGRHALAILLTPFTLGLYWFWFTALRHRYYWEKTSLAGVSFRSSMTGGALLGMVVTNALLVLCTLGIGYAWARVRAIRFHCDCVTMVGPADFAAIRQDAVAAEATGEGLTELLDVELVGADFFGL